MKDECVSVLCHYDLPSLHQGEILGDIRDFNRHLVTDLGFRNDSDVALQSRFWIADPSRADFMKFKGEYVTAVKEGFDVEVIDIPYPYRVLEGGLSAENIDAIRPNRESAE